MLDFFKNLSFSKIAIILSNVLFIGMMILIFEMYFKLNEKDSKIKRLHDMNLKYQIAINNYQVKLKKLNDEIQIMKFEEKEKNKKEIFLRSIKKDSKKDSNLTKLIKDVSKKDTTDVSTTKQSTNTNQDQEIELIYTIY